MQYKAIILFFLACLCSLALGDSDSESVVRNETSSDGKSDDTSVTKESNGTNVATEVPASNTTATDSSKVLSSVYITTVKPAPGSSLRETVFKENSLFGLFNSCRINGDGSKLLNASACFRDDEYNDRLTFEVIYNFPGETVSKAFKAHAPELQLLGGSSSLAQSTIFFRSVDVSASVARVSVSYDCNADTNGVLELGLHMRFSEGDDSKLSIFWTKQCMNGKNLQIEFGYTLEDSVKGEAEYHMFSSGADAPYVVVPSDKSTEVYAKLKVAGAQQAFLAPHVKSEDPSVVQVAVRGNHPNGGILKGLEPSVFQISYECLTGKGSSTISANVGIPPFQNLSASWEKECGGSIPKQLSVGSSEGAFDVVDLGKPTPKYMVAIDNIGTPHSEEHLHLPGNQSEWTIYLMYGDPNVESSVSSDESIHLGRVSVTVEHTDVVVALDAKVSKKGSLGWSPVENTENIIRSGDRLRITFRFVCRKKGESRILLSLPLVHYDMLEFGIAKECDHEEALPRPSQEWVLTVGNVFWGGIVFLIAGVAVIYLRSKRKLTQGFEPVSTSER